LSSSQYLKFELVKLYYTNSIKSERQFILLESLIKECNSTHLEKLLTQYVDSAIQSKQKDKLKKAFNAL